MAQCRCGASGGVFWTGLPSLFLYRDEFRSHLDARDLALPAILLGGEAPVPQVLVSAHELDALPDLPALIALLEARLAARAA